ncbi:MAG: DUF2147 domain-containing protein [Saprospiraceae bacterium]|nr:DUF2147 domain-containing protein [Saprospiraceae bacterium]
MRALVLSIFLLTYLPLVGQSPVGFWKTVDDVSGETRSIVEISSKDALLYGTVKKLLQDDPNTLCDACKGSNHEKPIQGMVIIQGMEKDGDRWNSGKILDPETGNVYRCIIWLEEGGDVLRVRGKHWTGLYRTQKWFRTATAD